MRRVCVCREAIEWEMGHASFIIYKLLFFTAGGKENRSEQRTTYSLHASDHYRMKEKMIDWNENTKHNGK